MSTSQRTLVMLRHAKAEQAAGMDELRALAIEGRRQARQLGRQLKDQGLAPELVLCSSALRAQQTWELAAHDLEVEPDVDLRDDLYTASPEQVVDLVRRIDERIRTVLIVGHEPWVSAVASLLSSEESDAAALAQVRVGVPTATFSVLSADDHWSDWAPGTVRLTGVFRPLS